MHISMDELHQRIHYRSRSIDVFVCYVTPARGGRPLVRRL